MNRISTFTLISLLSLCCVQSLMGFSLLGPTPAWQTTALGYTPPYGVMNLGDEYRRNVPIVYYGFSSDFLNYFGERGMQEVEKAIAILNDLPDASEIDINEYPTRAMRINHRAQALNLVDLKSVALQQLLSFHGLADPSRYVFTLRSRVTTPSTNYHVIKRNFDPETWEPSSYINGRLWTYSSIIDGTVSVTVNEPVDPLDNFGTIYAPVSSSLLGPGGFWTGLTRDDVGGLKYIYHKNNLNVEAAPTGAVYVSGGFSGGGQFAWPTVFGSGGYGDIWSTPDFGTNVAFPTNALTNLFQTSTNTNNVSAPILRAGVDKVAYERVEYDSLLGGFFVNVTNRWTETIFTNYNAVSQTLSRALTQPDIVFTAGDTGGGAAATVPADVMFTASNPTFANHFADNSLVAPASDNAGPGVIPVDGLNITFSKVGPGFINIYPIILSELASINSGLTTPLWGSFDGSTNPPIVYPLGTSIEAIEELALKGN
jgi:hypothetical protein